jgi:hypothetical protein
MSKQAAFHVERVSPIDGTTDLVVLISAPASSGRTSKASDTMTFETSPLIIRIPHSEGLVKGATLTLSSS